MEKVNVAENGQHVKLVKLKREFVWHHHDNEDEMFLVVKGSSCWSSGTGTCGLRKESSLSCREAWSIDPSQKRKRMFSYSSRRPR